MMGLLQKIEALAEARERAERGKWSDCCESGSWWVVVGDYDNELDYEDPHNNEFIVQAANSIIPIRDELRELVAWLEEEIKAAESALDNYPGQLEESVFYARWNARRTQAERFLARIKGEK